MKLLYAAVAFASIAAANDVAGKWDAVAVAPNGREYKIQLEFVNQEGKLGGSMSGPQGSIPLEQVEFNGKELSYGFTIPQGQYKVKLNLEEGTLKGTFTAPDGASGTLSASRAPATAAPAGPSLAGIWNLTAKDSGGREHKLKLSLKEEEAGLKGHFILSEGETIPVTELKQDGAELTFKVTGRNGLFNVKLAMVGSSLKGTYSGGNGESGQVEGTR
jgi:hypothetical protein